MEKIFVYGTLRVPFRGVPEGITHVSEARVRGRLYFAYPGSFPVMVPDEEGDLVVGDVLEFDPEGAWWQDVYRVETGAGYVLGEVKLADQPGVVCTWCWTRGVDEDLRITGGDWMEAVEGFGDESEVSE